MKREFSLLLSGTILCAMPALAGDIKGKIMDGALGGPMEFVNVSVVKAGSTQLSGGAVTASDGSFQISGLRKGDYVLSISYIGYKEIKKTFSIVGNSQVLDIGQLTLNEDGQVLNEVEIVGQKPAMRFEIDRKVFDPSQDISSEGGTASDVLSNIPSVEVDNEGQVSLRGNSSVTIWINGKASGLTADNQADILQLMPAETIKEVEVITNPSAKYSPEGTAGIINIVLKEDRKAGYYGSVKAGADTYGGYNASANINYSSSKVDAYASLNYRNSQMKGGGITERTNTGDNSFLNQTNSSNRDNSNWFGRAGATWHITNNDDLRVGLMGMMGNGNSDEAIHYLSGSALGDTIYTSDRLNDGNNKMRMYNIELGYIHKFSENSNLDFTLTHNQFNMNNDNIYSQSTLYTDPTIGLQQTYQFQNSDMKDKGWEAQLDYTNKLTENLRIEAGYKGTFSRNESPVDTYSGTTEADATQDKDLFNRFYYNQDVHALYMTLGGKWGNLSYQAGLRGEYWTVNTRSLSYAQAFEGEPADEFNKDFFKLFPSAFLSYALPKNNEIQLNYTRRLRRPWGGQLNSFRNISDASNISYGNPELTPEYSHSFELNYIKTWDAHTLSVSGYYRATDDVIQRIRFLNTEDNVMYTTSENVAKMQASGLELVGKNRLFNNILDLTTTVNLYYSKLDGFSYLPEGAKDPVTGDEETSFSWNARMIANVKLPYDISLQLTGSYNAKQLMAQGHREPNYSFDAGLRKSFLNRKITLSINARDLLDSRKFRTITSGDGFYQDAENWRGGRRIGFTITYNFGSMGSKKPARPEGFSGPGEPPF